MALILVFRPGLEVNSAAQTAECLTFIVLTWHYSWALVTWYKLLAFAEYLAVIPVNQDDISATLRF